MNKSFSDYINSPIAHTWFFRLTVVGWLTSLSIWVFITSASLINTQADIAKRLGQRYSTEDAKKDRQQENERYTDLQRQVGILQAQWKLKTK